MGEWGRGQGALWKGHANAIKKAKGHRPTHRRLWAWWRHLQPQRGQWWRSSRRRARRWVEPRRWSRWSPVRWWPAQSGWCHRRFFPRRPGSGKPRASWFHAPPEWMERQKEVQEEGGRNTRSNGRRKKDRKRHKWEEIRDLMIWIWQTFIWKKNINIWKLLTM